MKKFIYIILVLFSLLNIIFFFLFFDFQHYKMKLIFSEISIVFSLLVVMITNSLSSHEGFKIGAGISSLILAFLQVVISYFISTNLKFNFVFFVWVLFLFVQILIIALNVLIKPRQ
jgi:hypothetical protein